MRPASWALGSWAQSSRSCVRWTRTKVHRRERSKLCVGHLARASRCLAATPVSLRARRSSLDSHCVERDVSPGAARGPARPARPARLRPGPAQGTTGAPRAGFRHVRSSFVTSLAPVLRACVTSGARQPAPGTPTLRGRGDAASETAPAGAPHYSRPGSRGMTIDRAGVVRLAQSPSAGVIRRARRGARPSGALRRAAAGRLAAYPEPARMSRTWYFRSRARAGGESSS